MKHLVLAVALAMIAGVALAKLPPLDDAAKAKAAEAAAKAAWQGKADAYLTCKAQDRVVASYAKSGAKVAATPTPVPVAAKAAASAAMPAAPAASGLATPVASAPLTPCADPGPFAYNAPEQKPLETSGAHSPAGNATSPPSVKQDSATLAPAKK